MTSNGSDHYAQYGYRFLPTDDCFGVDVSHQHMDDLDNLSLKEVYLRAITKKTVNAVDLGGGFGIHSIRMAKLGASVTMFDRSDMASSRFALALKEENLPPTALQFIQKDFSSISQDDVPRNIDVLYSQRAIHYVPYNEARQLLGLFFNSMAKDSIAFISAAGCETESGKTHPDRYKPVQNRFGIYSDEMQKKHGITHKTVIYSTEDLKGLLIDVGFVPICVYQSNFGNVKSISHKIA